MTLKYQSGFGNEYATEAILGALPQGRNSPQRVAMGLYAELLSGTAFTAPRAHNRRTWMYRRQPSVVTGAYAPYEQALWTTGATGGVPVPPGLSAQNSAMSSRSSGTLFAMLSLISATMLRTSSASA